MSTTVRFGQTFVLCDAYLDQGHYVGATLSVMRVPRMPWPVVKTTTSVKIV